MKKITWQKFQDVRANHEFALERQGSYIMMALGLWLFSDHIFSGYPDLYVAMSSIASEKVWGVIFILVGMVQFYSLLADGQLRQTVLLLKGGMWVTLLINLTYGDWHVLSVPIYAIFAIGAFKTYAQAYRAARRKKPVE